MEEKIRARITQLKAERDAYVAQANQQLAAFNGAIQALEQLLAPEPAPAATAPESLPRELVTSAG